jgi:hypothetical protein
VRQNAGPIPALAGFKRVLGVIEYQEFMPDPTDSSDFSIYLRGFFSEDTPLDL